MNEARCPECGTIAVVGRSFCSACGRRLPVDASVNVGAVKRPTTGPPLPSLRPPHDSGDTTPPGATGGRAELAAPLVAERTRPWRRAAVGASAIVVAVALAAAVTLAGRTGDDPSTVDLETGGTGTEAPVTQAPPTPAPATDALDAGFRRHTGRFFTVDVPDSWQTTFEDRLVSVDPESFVTRWEDPFTAVLSVATSSPLTGTIIDDCRTIFGGRDRSSALVAPHLTDLGGRRPCEFAYVRPDGQVRVELLFAIGRREFLVTAGSGSRGDADGIARHALTTLRANGLP